MVLRYIQALEIDPAIINVNGGAIAKGHPLGATRAMILGTVFDELERTDRETALVNLCVGAAWAPTRSQRASEGAVTDNVRLDIDADGVALITFDLPGQSINMISHSVQRELGELAHVLGTDNRIVGVVL